MSIQSIRALFIGVLAVVALSGLGFDIETSGEPARDRPLKEVDMDKDMGLSIPDGYERATFGLG